MRKAIPKRLPLLRLAITIAQHCDDNVVMGVPPAPNVSRFISGAELVPLGNNASLANSIEECLKNKVRAKVETFLTEKLGAPQARNYCMMLETQLIRMAFGKSLHPVYPGCAGACRPSKKGGPFVRARMRRRR